MRRLTLAALLLALTAASAEAKTYNGMAFAGPTISGDSVVWGTEYSDGTGAVKVDGRIRVIELNQQGYGLQLIFSDGHERGIYPWPYLSGLT